MSGAPDRFLSIAVFLNRRSKGSRDQVSGIMRFAAKRDFWDLHILSRPSNPKDMKNLLSTIKPDGIIAGSSYIVKAFHQRMKADIPSVVLDCFEPKGSGVGGIVLCADHEIGRQAGKFFIAKGFTNFAFAGICGEHEDFESFNSVNRRNGFFRTVAKAGNVAGAYEEELSPGALHYADTTRLGRWLLDLPKPCAILAHSDSLAQSIVRTCRMRRIPVPLQVSVMGIGNDQALCENITPTLSSIEPDYTAAGYKAAELLDAQLASNARSSRTIRVLYGVDGLVERMSTSNIAGNRIRVARATEIIRKRALEGITSKQVAEELGVSPRSLELAFRNASRRTVRDEILDIRLKEAARLLKSTVLRSSEIAARCGFRTAGALKMIFKKKYGMSMREWRGTS